MNFLAKDIAKGVSGVDMRMFMRAVVLATLAFPMIGCGADSGGPLEGEEEIDSTSEALAPIASITNSARLLGCPNERAALKSIEGQYYVTAEQTGDGAMVCDRTVADSWEVFQVKEITYTTGAKRIALKSDTGSGPYVSATGGGGSSIYANRPAIGDWESFAVISLSTGIGPRKALQASSGHYVTREDNGGPGCVLNANRPGIGTWETFQVECY